MVLVNKRVPVHMSVHEMSDDVSSIAENLRRPNRMSQRISTVRTNTNDTSATVNAMAT